MSGMISIVDCVCKVTLCGSVATLIAQYNDNSYQGWSLDGPDQPHIKFHMLWSSYVSYDRHRSITIGIMFATWYETLTQYPYT